MPSPVSSTGERKPGEYLTNARAWTGSGHPHPSELQHLSDDARGLPAARGPQRLEKHYRDMQTWSHLERGKLRMLQTRTKRTAAPRSRRSMVNEGLITAEEALARVEPEHVTSAAPRLSIPRPSRRP